MNKFVKIFTADAVMDDDATDIDLNGGAIRSKDRVKDQAEVFTQDREVNAMLDIIQEGPVDPAMSHLEPSCGNGQFLVQIIRRKLDWIDANAAPEDVTGLVLVALGSTVGVDISIRNVSESQDRIWALVDPYLGTPEAISAAWAVICSNVVVGNLLKASGGVPVGSPEHRKLSRTDQMLFGVDPQGEFSERVRVIRLGLVGNVLRLVSGTIGGTDTETLGRFSACAGGLSWLDEQIRNMAECDECRIHGRQPKPLKVGKLDYASCASEIRIPDNCQVITVG